MNDADAEEMFLRIDRRARTLLVRSFQSFSQFIEAIEYVVLHFIQVRSFYFMSCLDCFANGKLITVV